MFRSLRRRFALAATLLTLLVGTVLLLYLPATIYQLQLDNFQQVAVAEAQSVGELLPPWEGGPASSELETAVRRQAALLGGRLTLFAVDGTLIADSENPPLKERATGPAYQQAQKTNKAVFTLSNTNDGIDKLVVIVAVRRNGQQELVRLAKPLSPLKALVTRLRRVVLLTTIVIALIAGVMAGALSTGITLPLQSLAYLAKRMTAGDMDGRLRLSSHNEIGQLATAFNDMATTIQNKLQILSAQRSTLQTVLRYMPDGVVVTGSWGEVRLINFAASRMLHFPQEQAAGKSFVLIARDHRLVNPWQRCRENNKEQMETVELGSRGSFLQLVVTPLRGASPGSCLVLMKDLTRIHRLETVRRDFISNLSHELRTPLASLKALVETLQGGALEDPPAANRFLHSIETEVDALSHLVEDLLALSRMESGNMPMHFATTQVDRIVVPAVKRLRPLAERAGLQLFLDIAAATPSVSADVQRMQQVLINLIHNAIKFTPPGGTITVRVAPKKEEIDFSVTDTGVGIPAETLPRIFERFYKIDSARSASNSTGLGLAIAKHIVLAHNGRIWAESIEGHGATFHVTLPLR